MQWNFKTAKCKQIKTTLMKWSNVEQRTPHTDRKWRLHVIKGGSTSCWLRNLLLPGVLFFSLTAPNISKKSYTNHTFFRMFSHNLKRLNCGSLSFWKHKQGQLIADIPVMCTQTQTYLNKPSFLSITHIGCNASIHQNKWSSCTRSAGSKTMSNRSDCYSSPRLPNNSSHMTKID